MIICTNKLYNSVGDPDPHVFGPPGSGSTSQSMDRCGVAQLVARRLAVRQARVRFSARHHREVLPLSKQAMKKWREASANGDG
jgi:hypothetical protein